MSYNHVICNHVIQSRHGTMPYVTAENNWYFGALGDRAWVTPSASLAERISDVREKLQPSSFHECSSYHECQANLWAMQICREAKKSHCLTLSVGVYWWILLTCSVTGKQRSVCTAKHSGIPVWTAKHTNFPLICLGLEVKEQVVKNFILNTGI